ncbi:hypothetical protein ID866_6862 [Astraeus odoratus]|nr:hypothetical protein ID866_6862 [Astraeus odoratus]
MSMVSRRMVSTKGTTTCSLNVSRSTTTRSGRTNTFLVLSSLISSQGLWTPFARAPSVDCSALTTSSSGRVALVTTGQKDVSLFRDIAIRDIFTCLACSCSQITSRLHGGCRAGRLGARCRPQGG